MPTLPTKVQPGDLITSELMNRLIDVCADLQQRVDDLEEPSVSPAGTQITALLPSGEKRIGDALHIIGWGFDVPQGNIVTIDGIGVQPSPGADRDRELIVTIPNVQGVTASGKSVTLVVSNAKGTDVEDFVVFPAVETVPEGQLFVNLTQPPADPALLAGHSYTFVYTIQAVTNLPETYALTATTSTGWSAQIVDTADNPLVPAEISMPSAPPPAGATQTVRVRVSIPAGTAPGTSALVRLTVTSKRNPTGLVGRSGGEAISVGSAPPPAVTIPITLGGVTRLSAAQPPPTTSGGVLRIGADVGNYRVTFNAQIKAATVYQMQLDDPGSGWTASFSASESVNSQNMGPVASDTNQPIFVFLKAAGGAPAGELTLSVTSTTDAAQSGQIRQSIALLS